MSGHELQPEQQVSTTLRSNTGSSVLISTLILEQTIHTRTRMHIESPGSQSADTLQSYVSRLASVHSDSWGTNRAMEAAGEFHITPPPPLQQHPQKETQHMSPHAQKSTTQLFLTSYAQNDTITAERTLITHTHAQLSTCLHRPNSCRSLREVGLCSRNICPPNLPIYIPHRLQGVSCAVLHAVFYVGFFSTKNFVLFYLELHLIG